MPIATALSSAAAVDFQRSQAVAVAASDPGSHLAQGIDHALHWSLP